MSAFTKGANKVDLSIGCRGANSYAEVQYVGLKDALSRQCNFALL